jgi:hypothetical protein
MTGTQEARIGQDQITRLLLAGGVGGPPLFVAVLLLEGATRPGYNAWVQAGSALSLSRWGWVQMANFVVCGVLVFGFALGLRRLLAAGGRGSTWGPRLIAAFGLALVVAGVFVTDPAQGYPPGTPSGPAVATTWHGAIHAFAGLMVFAALLPSACYVMASYFANASGGRGWALYSIATGIVIWASFVDFIVAGARNGPAGFYERIAILAGWGWIAFLAFRYLPQTRPSASAARSARGTGVEASS